MTSVIKASDSGNQGPKTGKSSHTVFKENLTSDIRKFKTTALYKDNLATGECYKEGIDAWETDRLSGD